MAYVTFRYSPLSPAGPTALVAIGPPEKLTLVDQSALIDTGADQTVVPQQLIDQLDISPNDKELVKGFDGAVQELATFAIQLQIKLLKPVHVSVIVSSLIPFVILGRDVLNNYVIKLDGPSQRVEISEP